MGKVILLNYADERFAVQQKYNFKSAKLLGGFDEFHLMSNKDIDEEFKQLNRDILILNVVEDCGFGSPILYQKH